MTLLIHSQTSTVVPLKFENGKVISSQTLPGMWLFVHVSKSGHEFHWLGKHPTSLPILNTGYVMPRYFSQQKSSHDEIHINLKLYVLALYSDKSWMVYTLLNEDIHVSFKAYKWNDFNMHFTSKRYAESQASLNCNSVTNALRCSITHFIVSLNKLRLWSL